MENNFEKIEMPFDDELRWRDIKSSLIFLSKKIRTGLKAKFIIEAILAYNLKKKNQWDFSNLSLFFEQNENENFSKKVIPFMIDLVLNVSKKLLKEEIQILKQGMNFEIGLDQLQCACILANAFFCTFKSPSNEKLSSINFNRLFAVCPKGRDSAKIQKIKCLMHYFERISSKKDYSRILFIRSSFNSTLNDLFNSKHQLIYPQLELSKKIEECQEAAHVDFANMFIGGGVLRSGCIQEEIQFITSPELIVSILFTECLGSNEAFLINGYERYSSYEGYSDTFKWKSNFIDYTKKDNNNILSSCLILIDAINYQNKIDQFQENNIEKEFIKCYTGFELVERFTNKSLKIATGHWGCGAFGGDKIVKFLIQMIVSSHLNRQLIYCLFDEVESLSNFKKLIEYLELVNLNTFDLYSHLISYGKSRVKNEINYSFLDYVISDIGTLV